MRSISLFVLLSVFLVVGCLGTSKKGKSDAAPADVLVDGAVSDGTSTDSGAATDQTPPTGDATDATTSDTAIVDAAVTDIPAVDSGGTDAGGIESGCTPEEQEAVFSVNPGSIVQLCKKNCPPGNVECVEECFAEKTGISLECASCFGQTYACLLENCAAVCDEVTSAECEQCAADEGCFEALSECVGMNQGPPEGDGMCQGPDMEAVAQAGDALDTLLQACNEQCDFDAACMQDCMAAELGVSEDCAQCFGAFMGCAEAMCKAECSDFTSEGCDTCLNDSPCKGMLFSCTGVYTEPLGACLMTDLIILGEQGEAFPLLANECWEICGDPTPECLGDCIEENLGMSASCSECYGEFFGCAFNHCPVECKNSIDDEECAVCVDESGCLGTDCFGFGGPPPEDGEGSDDGPPPDN